MVPQISIPPDSPLRRYPRASLTFVFFLVSLVLLNTFKRTPYEDPSAPSLAARLDRSDALWRHSVEQRHALVASFGDRLDPFPAPPAYYTLWSLFTPSYNCPWEVQRVGTIMDGGRWLGESSFEAEILGSTKCKVYGYDAEARNWGPEITTSPTLKTRATFFPYAIGAKNAHTATPPMWTLRTLMKAHGHKHISILRIDAEGGEFELLRAILAEYREAGEPLPFGQLLVEIHALGKSVQFMKEWWEMLEEAGLRAFMTEPNLVFAAMARKDAPPGLSEFSFINVYGDHNLIIA